MDRRRWQDVVRLYESAVEMQFAEREPFPRSACASDSWLRREVEELLAEDVRPALTDERTPDNRMVATEITIAGGRLDVGRSRTLFDMGNLRRGGMSWDVSPDGQRFLVVVPTDLRSETSIGLLQNWPALLRRQ